MKSEINQKKMGRNYHNSIGDTNTIWYVEKLLSIQIQDHRKFAISLLLAPYSINIQNLSDSDSFSKIKRWVLKCNEVRKLEPTAKYFDDFHQEIH